MNAPAPDPPAELPVYPRLPFDVVGGEGVFVHDAEGRRYLDLYGGHAVATLGHSHPRLVEAIATQAATLMFQTNAVELPVRREAARRLVDFAPEGISRCFFVNSGAEANENALRLAVKQTGRGVVVALEQGFHGRTAAAGACTFGSSKWYGFPRTPFEVRFVPPDDVEALERALGSDCAALILEPVQGIGGARDLDLDYLRAARELTRRAGALFIADEVQCGIGRCGTRFAIDAAGVVPDLLTCAKGLAGGFPAGAVLTGEEVASRVGPGDLGSTFGGGPVACAAMIVVLDAVAEDGFLRGVRDAEAWIRAHCQLGPVRSIQGRGLLLGLQLDRPAKEVLPRLRADGILAGSASQPDVVRLMPPLTITPDELGPLRDSLRRIEGPSA